VEQRTVDLRNVKIVDSREPGEIRDKLLTSGWWQEQLLSGDYSFYTCQYHRVGITRKTTDDFLGSINDRFSKQLEEMLDFYHVCIILIENPWNWAGDKMISSRGQEHITKQGVLNYLHRWQAKGFILERTIDWRDSVERLNELYALYQHSYSLSARSKGYSDERLLALPCGLRGKSGQMLLQSRSLRQIANMSKADLLSLSLEGIGEKRAQLVEEHFTRTEAISGEH